MDKASQLHLRLGQRHPCQQHALLDKQPVRRNPRPPDIPASTIRLEDWFGYFKPRARLTRG